MSEGRFPIPWEEWYKASTERMNNLGYVLIGYLECSNKPMWDLHEGFIFVKTDSEYTTYSIERGQDGSTMSFPINTSLPEFLKAYISIFLFYPRYVNNEEESIKIRVQGLTGWIKFSDIDLEDIKYPISSYPIIEKSWVPAGEKDKYKEFLTK